MPSPSIVWFRDDLRLADNPALTAAATRDETLVALYILDEESPGFRPLGGAARWWLHGSLASLAERLDARGVQLVLRRGSAARVIPELAKELGAGAVFWNRRYSDPERTIDAGIKADLRDSGVEAVSFAASLLFEPWTVTTGAGTPYSVFTPFWRACLGMPAPRAPLPEPEELRGLVAGAVASDALDGWELLPTRPDWAAGLRETWRPGEPAAVERLETFLEEDVAAYERARDEPSAGATSLLSPRLRWGELSPFTVWHSALATGGTGGFLSELGWREFAWHTLFRFPELATRNLRSEFDAFPWPPIDEDHLSAWQRGRTGVPLVDAGMRELWHTGYMHNRVRMVAASFLVKNLLIDWRVGEEWFWDTLVDADAASNAFNWQWVAGSGADAAPYFRVFNPALQAKKFDAHGLYIAQWAPDSPAEPIVDLRESRAAALEAYERVRLRAR
ncbi:DNA photolyase family protein [Salinibacterium sp. SYSU T00001]|uniref:cryptochrome/photolyase family protein n=1 Tax=Homoserinimonas sedimenticola TaxID=2986805 RepID=UPI0022358B21|nr:deoxyribodipyrimidine photo-lyase [Salinibacterium sedimenticola]MCW4384310.1 DNA photolyase family protein [Salinibacterium sedimenticola]